MSNANTPESFGIYPGDPEYGASGQDYPISDIPTTDSVVVFPETAEEEAERINTWLKEFYSNQ